MYLAGNPVAHPAEAYRAALLPALPRLEQLDSDMVDRGGASKPLEPKQAQAGS